MIIELSDFFNNPSLIEIGWIRIQYYAVTWVLSAIFIFQYLKNHRIIGELKLSADQVNDIVFLYGLIRFFIEYFRQPDSHMGFVALQLSMGQVLSIPMVIIGLILLTKSIRRNEAVS